jgi:hypothetical protein
LAGEHGAAGCVDAIGQGDFAGQPLGEFDPVLIEQVGGRIAVGDGE